MRYLFAIPLALIVLMALACTTPNIDATVEARAKELVAEQAKPNPDLALEYYERAYDQYQLAVDHKSLGGLQLAVRDFTRAIELGLPTTYPYNLQNPLALGYLLRGGSYLGLNEYQNAIEDFDKVIRINPDNGTTANAYGARGEAYEALGQTANAEADYAKACSLDSEHC